MSIQNGGNRVILPRCVWGGKKSLLCDPGSELRPGGREIEGRREKKRECILEEFYVKE